MNVEITIDEVVLRGVPPEEAHAVLAALHASLTARAGDWALAAGAGGDLADRTEASARPAAVDAPSGSPAQLGQAVAGAVWSTLAGGEGRR